MKNRQPTTNLVRPVECYFCAILSFTTVSCMVLHHFQTTRTTKESTINRLLDLPLIFFDEKCIRKLTVSYYNFNEQCRVFVSGWDGG